MSMHNEAMQIRAKAKREYIYNRKLLDLILKIEEDKKKMDDRVDKQEVGKGI